MDQTMSAMAAQQKINREAERYAKFIRDEAITLEQAHAMLVDKKMSLFQIGGLAKAIACFQCSE